jgi:prepilin-type N-terminal cleavage/methylation domain-containing protein
MVNGQRDWMCGLALSCEKGKIIMKNSGFTLFELMVVIAIIAILSSFTIVNFIGWLPKYKLSSAARTMLCTLQLARVAAVNKNSIVSVVFSPGTRSCLAFLDNGDGGGTADDGHRNGTERLVRKFQLPAGVDFKEVPTSLKFNNRGMPILSASVDIKVKNKVQSKTVTLLLSGKSRIL